MTALYNRFLTGTPADPSRSAEQNMHSTASGAPEAGGGLSGLLGRLGLRAPDRGDLLLMLILMLLASEDEDGWETLPVIALIFLMS